MRVTLAVAKRVLTQLHRDPRTLMLVFVVPSLLMALLCWILIDTPMLGRIAHALFALLQFLVMPGNRRMLRVSTEVDHPTTRQRWLPKSCTLTQSWVTLTSMKRALASTLLLASGLAMSACGAPNAAQDSPETVTVKQTVTEYEDPKPA